MYFVILILGLLIGIGAVWAVNKGLKTAWYDWLLAAIAVIFAMATVQHYLGEIRTFEPTAAWMGSLIFGIIALIFAAIAGTLVWRRNKTA